MKKIILTFALLTNFCFACPYTVSKNLDKIFLATSKEISSSIEFLSTLINDDSILDLDKIHYLICRSQLYNISNYSIEYNNDINTIYNLCEKNESCYDEVRIYYETNLPLKFLYKVE